MMNVFLRRRRRRFAPARSQVRTVVGKWNGVCPKPFLVFIEKFLQSNEGFISPSALSSAAKFSFSTCNRFEFAQLYFLLNAAYFIIIIFSCDRARNGKYALK